MARSDAARPDAECPIGVTGDGRLGSLASMTVDRAGLHRFARAHHGVVSQREARTFGVSVAMWGRWARSGELEVLHPGVAALASSPRSLDSSIRAAVLACPTGATASLRSAAYLHGCWPTGLGQPPVEVTVGRGGPRALEGVVLHRPRDHQAIIPVRRSGIETTNPIRTLGDLGQVVYPDQLADIIFAFTRRNLVDVNALRADAIRRRKPGRFAPDVLLEVLARVANDDGVLASELERRVVDAIAATNLPQPKRNFRVVIDGEVMLLDLAWPTLIYTVDLDGARFHADRFDADRARDVRLRTAGWTVDRFTWTHATTQMPWLLGTIRSRLTERGWSGG